MSESRCELIGKLFGNKWQRCIDMVRRVYSVEGISPTITTFGGGNTESKVLVPNYRNQTKETLDKNDCAYGETIDEFNQRENTNGNNPKIKTHPDGIKAEILTVIPNNRIRKLTERECFRLMGVKDKDFEKIEKNQSRSGLYHLAGDSIVTNVLSAIFAEMIKIKL